VLNESPDEKAWVRFTLSEIPAPHAPYVLPDGRGPHPPYAYRVGETEDYLWRPPDPGEPGKIEIVKSSSVPSGGTVAVGDVFTYSIELGHLDGTAFAHTAMTDTLPAAVRLVRGPFVTELAPHASPLVAYFDSSGGPSGTVGWGGRLSPGARIRIDFAVRVRFCPPVDPPMIVNVARALQTDGSEIEDDTSVRVDCHPPPPPDIKLTKRAMLLWPEAVVEWGEPVDPVEPALEPVEAAEADLVPGMRAAYLLVLETSEDLTRTVHISDDMPSGVVAIAASASSGVARIIDTGQTVIWDGELGPANTPIHIRMQLKLRWPVHCDQTVTNVAYWFTRFHRGKSNPASLFLRCRDLGDAPDSTNHYGAGMRAYPSAIPVLAAFPTVFTGTRPLEPHGPLHLHARPYHLGRHVSFETEADIGPDADGRNNIVPRLDRPNLDRWDDGLDLRQVHFDHCQRARFPVVVNVTPPVAQSVDGMRPRLYLNVWVDSNRDGDWADSFRGCPSAGPALEHIVIDWPVPLVTTAASLGPQTVWVTTSGPVYWPAEMADRPAWLRVTLSERESNKTLPPGVGTYGDGRGHDVPFKLGETEDYLYRSYEYADPTVAKWGRLSLYPHPHFDATDTRWGWVADWAVEYRNAGRTPARDVRVVDTYGPNQTLISQRTYPHIPPVSMNPLVYPVGTLAPGERGYVLLRTGVSIHTPPGTVLTNTVVIASGNDSDLANNTATVTLTVPLRPPVITFPRPGTTCTNTLTVRGLAQPEVLVDLIIDEMLVTTISPVDGRWSHTVRLADGKHALYAVARTPDGLASQPSPTVVIIVDSELSWNPLSLRFVDEDGRVIFPKDANGRIDETGWRVFLRRNTTYTVSVALCCTDPNAKVTLGVPDVAEIELTDPDGDRVFEATFTTPDTGPVHGTLRLCVTCYLVERCSDGTVLVDPEGTVYDLLGGRTLPGATVACYELQADGEGESAFTLWNGEAYGQVNPQTTREDGTYSFFTPPGTYQIDVVKRGYQDYRSETIIVAEEPVHYDVPLTPELDVTPDHTVTVAAEGFEPAMLRVAPGTVVAWLNLDIDPHSSTSVSPTVGFSGGNGPSGGGSAGWDSGRLSTGQAYHMEFEAPGLYLYHDSEDPFNSGMIIVEEQKAYLPLVMAPGD
jgi:plastocyanin